MEMKVLAEIPDDYTDNESLIILNKCLIYSNVAEDILSLSCFGIFLICLLF